MSSKELLSNRFGLNAPVIRHLLARRNETQREAAENIGTTFRYFSELMHHRRVPSPGLRRRIQIYFCAPGVKFDDLFVSVKVYRRAL